LTFGFVGVLVALSKATAAISPASRADKCAAHRLVGDRRSDLLLTRTRATISASPTTSMKCAAPPCRWRCTLTLTKSALH